MRYLTMMLTLALVSSMGSSVVGQSGLVQISVVDDAGDRLPCRIHLYNADGEPQRAEGLPFFRDHFVCPGEAELNLPVGEYRVEVERGPEYAQGAESFTIAESERMELSVPLKRIANLAAEGWYSGDLHVHRAVEDMPLLMRAEDLHIAPVITWWNDTNLWSDREGPDNALVRFDGNRYYHLMAGEDEREGGALMFFNLGRVLPIAGSTREYPSPMKFVIQARRHPGVWIDIEKPFWWDVPVWLASGMIDSIGLANNHMCRSSMYEDEAWGKPRDVKRLPAPLGNGYWTQEIYYHILNCGLRIAPSAGSASGVLPNPLGYNRVYVYCDESFDYESWWQGLKAGRSFVTNGPLLVARANGQLPGHVFRVPDQQTLEIAVEVSLTSRDRIASLDIIKNGQVERTVPATGLSQSIHLGKLTFDRSGWFLVRAVTDLKNTFRFASSAPYYVEVGADRRYISRRSANFFLDWVAERMGRIPMKLDDADKLEEVLIHHDEAKRFWQDLAARANAD